MVATDADGTLKAAFLPFAIKTTTLDTNKVKGGPTKRHVYLVSLGNVSVK